MDEETTIYNLADFLGLKVYREVGIDGMPTGDSCVVVDEINRVVTVGVLPESEIKKRLVRAARRKIDKEIRKDADNATKEAI